MQHLENTEKIYMKHLRIYDQQLHDPLWLDAISEP